MTTTTEYTAEQKHKIVVAYLAQGNSFEDIVMQYVETLHGGVEGAYEAFFDIAIHQDLIESRAESPDSFETTVDEELQQCLDLYDSELAYISNTPVAG